MSGPAQHGKFIIVLEKGVDDSTAESLRQSIHSEGGNAEKPIKIGNGFHSITATLPDSMLQSFTANPHIQYIEPDGEVSIQAKEILNAQKK
ncbi:hypothetical protein BDF19DRAFT_449623 [Syncephalis fuscata]|nr:hypothetical protein BDF19DRAFT_449623 [Syncephalis fuscata]